MEIAQNFILAFAFSFFGSIPPGTINLTILQLGLEHKIAIAFRLALAASIIEYPYAWLAVEFEGLITSSPIILENIKLIGTVLLLTLGIINVWSARKPTAFTLKFQASGFRRGMLLGLLNPMAMPYWIAITAYLRIEGWIAFTSSYQLHSYLLGITIGAFAILMLIGYMARRVATMLTPGSFFKYLPGVVFLVLGTVSLVRYIIS
jgi:threonine/homoserine/homoserine lactone efflux protein